MALSPGTPTRLVTGCDVTGVGEIRGSIAAFGERYLSRVFTDLEQQQSAGSPERLAGRFAAKESVVKLLRPDPTTAIPYLDIEVRSAPGGAPRVRLHRAARKRALELGLGPVALSLSHHGDIAFATAVAVLPRKEQHDMTDTIRSVLAQYGNLSSDVATLADGDDLYQAGLASHATVNVMLALEDELDVEFPDELLTRSTFASISSLAAAVSSLQQPA